MYGFHLLGMHYRIAGMLHMADHASSCADMGVILPELISGIWHTAHSRDLTRKH